MIYIVVNIFLNKNVYNMEFRNSSLEKTFIKSSANSLGLEIGDFVRIEKSAGKNTVVEKVEVPEDYMDYYNHGKLTYEELYNEFRAYYDEITEDSYKLLLDETIFKNLSFFKYPAAKNIHHAYIGGLAEHTLNMIKISESFIKFYKLDRELLWMGIILHDYSKINELTHYGLNYSIEGNLIGHLVMTVEEIVKISVKYDFEKDQNIILLKHLILSHHGRLDYGSPKEPMTKEAYILSQLDEIDAKMNVLDNAFETAQDNALTPPIMAFDKRRFFKMKKEED